MEHDEARICSVLAKQTWRYAVVGRNLERFGGSTGERGRGEGATFSLARKHVGLRSVISYNAPSRHEPQVVLNGLRSVRAVFWLVLLLVRVSFGAKALQPTDVQGRGRVLAGRRFVATSPEWREAKEAARKTFWVTPNTQTAALTRCLCVQSALLPAFEFLPRNIPETFTQSFSLSEKWGNHSGEICGIYICLWPSVEKSPTALISQEPEVETKRSEISTKVEG